MDSCHLLFQALRRPYYSCTGAMAEISTYVVYPIEPQSSEPCFQAESDPKQSLHLNCFFHSIYQLYYCSLPFRPLPGMAQAPSPQTQRDIITRFENLREEAQNIASSLGDRRAEARVGSSFGVWQL